MKTSSYFFASAVAVMSGSAGAFDLGGFAKGLQQQMDQMNQQLQDGGGTSMPAAPNSVGQGGQRGMFEIAADVEKQTKRGPVGRLSLGFDQIASVFGGFSEKISPDDPRSKYVGQILRTLALASRMPYVYQGWTPILVVGPGDASAASGGLIQVQTGLFNMAETEDELAGVLAHEMAHVELDASNYDFKAKVSAGAFDEMTKDPNNPNDMSFAQNMYAVETMRGFSARSEFEADERAVQVLHAAGYNPYALCRLIERLTGEDAVSVEKGGRYRRINNAIYGDGKSEGSNKYPQARATLCLDSIENGLGLRGGDPGDPEFRTARFENIVRGS